MTNPAAPPPTSSSSGIQLKKERNHSVHPASPQPTQTYKFSKGFPPSNLWASINPNSPSLGSPYPLETSRNAIIHQEKPHFHPVSSVPPPQNEILRDQKLQMISFCWILFHPTNQMGACHWCVICPGRWTVHIYFINCIFYAIMICYLSMYGSMLCEVLIVSGCYVRCSMCWCCRNVFLSVSVFRAGVWLLCRVWIERGHISPGRTFRPASSIIVRIKSVRVWPNSNDLASVPFPLASPLRRASSIV